MEVVSRAVEVAGDDELYELAIEIATKRRKKASRPLGGAGGGQ